MLSVDTLLLFASPARHSSPPSVSPTTALARYRHRMRGIWAREGRDMSHLRADVLGLALPFRLSSSTLYSWFTFDAGGSSVLSSTSSCPCLPSASSSRLRANSYPVSEPLDHASVQTSLRSALSGRRRARGREGGGRDFTSSRASMGRREYDVSPGAYTFRLVSAPSASTRIPPASLGFKARKRRGGWLVRCAWSEAARRYLRGCGAAFLPGLWPIRPLGRGAGITGWWARLSPRGTLLPPRRQRAAQHWHPQ
ncbi:hypothetical protein DFH09DRAFT_1144562 [Mycena vulgaris]|nr:hypothetical protein DFH09DRAFT_1144562 [Mycena vulgaris]